MENETERLVLSFSAGADSIGALLRIKETETFDLSTALLYYFYYIPGIPFVDDYIDYFEDALGVKIIKLPSVRFLSDMSNYLYQTPLGAMAIADLQKSRNYIPTTKTDKLEKILFENEGLSGETIKGIGVKRYDSFMRMKAMDRLEIHGINLKNRKWYPVWDYKDKDIINIIKRHRIKVPMEYQLFGISYENIDPRFLGPLVENCPKTMEIIKKYFPLCETMISRNEHYHPEWNKKHGVMYNKFDSYLGKPEDY